MPEIDYVTERHKLLEELRHHHTAPSYVALERTDPARPYWRVGGERGENCPSDWAGLPIVYIPERDIPRRDTRDWVRRTNPLTHEPEN
jgi:hypothetical protein